MNLWEQMLSGWGVQNGAESVNREVESNVGAQRNSTGSFDPNAIRSSMPEALDPQLHMTTQLTDARLAALRENMKPPEQSPLQFFGRALSAASVPVAYGTGNWAFGQKMAGNTMADQWNERVANSQDALQKSIAGTVDEAYQQTGNSAVDYMKDQREKKADSRKKLLGLIMASRDENGNIDPAAMADLEAFVQMNGFAGGEWEQIKQSLKMGTPQDPNKSPVNPEVVAPPAPQAGQPAPFKPDLGGTPPSPAPTSPAPTSPAMAPPGAPVLQGLSKIAANLPGSSPPEPPPSTAYEQPPEIKALYRQAHRILGVDPERGKAMLESAQIADRAAAQVWQKKAESQYDSRAGDFSTTNIAQFRNRKTNEMRPGQYGPRGVKLSDMLDNKGNPIIDPDFNAKDWEYVGPAELAGLKASMGEQGKAQGIAAAALPQYEREADSMVMALQDLKKHPGLKKITGTIGGWTPNFSSDAAQAEAMWKQINGKVFLQAYNNLRGAGQITEQEGLAAQEAYSVLRTLNVNDAEYPKMLDKFMVEVEQMRQVARKKAASGLINPNAKVVDIGRGKKLYKSADGNWYESETEALGESARSRNSAAAGGSDRLSGMKIERVQ